MNIPQASDPSVDAKTVDTKIPAANKYYNDNREYICMKCGKGMSAYSFGLGSNCRCTSCGYKDPCCE